MKLIDKDALVAEIESLLDKGRYHEEYDCAYRDGNNSALYALKGKINTIEVKEVGLIIHTIIAECCDWLAMNTNLSHDEIEGCRNLMLTVKDEQLKAQKGE